VQPPGPDVFSLLVDAGGKFRDGLDGVFGDVQLQTFGFEQCDVLLDERVLGLGENTNEVFFLQRLQLDPNRM
jgi:hypothetical protein